MDRFLSKQTSPNQWHDQPRSVQAHSEARSAFEQDQRPVKKKRSIPISSTSHELVNEIIYVSDEEIGVCGGVVTRIPRENPDPSTRALLMHWKTLSPLPMIRPYVKEKPSNLRPVVIDGSNVSYLKGLFYGSRIRTCVQAFAQAGHDVKAFVPEFRTMHPLTRESEILDYLEDSGFLVLTPSRSVDFQRLTPYDDRFIVEYADLTGAVIVSNDRFADLLFENESWRDTIRRRLSFCWHQDSIYFPKHPLGEQGPTLDEFLRKDHIAIVTNY